MDSIRKRLAALRALTGHLAAVASKLAATSSEDITSHLQSQAPETLVTSFSRVIASGTSQGTPHPILSYPVLSRPLVQSRASSEDICPPSFRSRDLYSMSEPGLRPGGGSRPVLEASLGVCLSVPKSSFLFSAMFHEQGYDDGVACKVITT